MARLIEANVKVRGESGLAAKRPSLSGQQLWVPHDLPEMMIGILKIACVTTPKGFLRWLDDDRTCALCLLHNGIDLGSGRDVMANREFGWVWSSYRNSCIVSKAADFATFRA